MADVLQSFLAQAQDLATLADLNALFRRTMRERGFTAYAAGPLFGAAPAFFLLDWPQAWLELYAHQGFAQEDVLLAEAVRSPIPFTWLDIRRQSPGASARVFAAAETFGWRDGFAVPAHGPGDEKGIVSLAAAEEVPVAGRGEIATIALAAYERARELFTGARRPDTVKLSRREREAIEWVSQGNSDGEIGERMGISKVTAHFHVEQARKKLGASTRAHAVALALAHRVL